MSIATMQYTLLYSWYMYVSNMEAIVLLLLVRH